MMAQQTSWWTRERKLRALAIVLSFLLLSGLFASLLGGGQ